jgi:N-acetylglucosaminyl-diphospho-decaprenol L-rhamnosyltransferase
MAPSVNTVVVDNGSSDDTLSVAREQTGWTVLDNRENRGFAAAVNQGVRATDAEFVLLLNPDVRLLTSVDELIRATHEYGLAGGKLVDQKNRPQEGFTIRRFPTAASLVLELLGVNRLWPRNPVNRGYRYLDRSLEQPGHVDQPAGAFLMFRRDVWQHLDGFDEQFFPIWFEDVDFCRRAAAAGYKIEYVPSVVAEHRGGHSVGLLSPGCRAIFWCDSLLKYAAKHFRFLAYRAVCLAVVLTSVPRMVAGMILERSFLPIVSYLKIARMALRRLVSVRAAIPASQDS